MSNETQVKKLTDESQLVAGILYGLVLRRCDYERNEDYDSFDALVYWNGYEFVNDEGDTCSDDWDYVIAQSDKPDPEYISPPQFVNVDGKEIDRNEWRRISRAKWRSDCEARRAAANQRQA